MARVEADLGRIVEASRRADPALQAVVLTGGFARGEGALLRGRPLNDYDLLAVRGAARAARWPRPPYGELRARLEAGLGVHVDLQPVWAPRLRLVPPTVFWYETALRGHVLWGRAGLGAIPVREPAAIERAEGLRLVANRAAGLLLALPSRSPRARMLQASKALLAVLDAHLLALGRFAPSQRERWVLFRDLEAAGRAPEPLARRRRWLAWALRYKLDPAGAARPRARDAWTEASAALLEAVPAALGAAGHRSLEDYARADRPWENAAYRLLAQHCPGARRWGPHPTGRVRAAGIALLRERCEGAGGDGPGASELLAPLVRRPTGPSEDLPILAELRKLTRP